MSSLTLSLIQADLAWEDKASNLKKFSEKISALAGNTQIVILPEMFNTGFSMNAEKLAEDMNGDTIQWMQKIAAENKIILCGSLIIRENNNYYNRLIWMLPNGKMAHYDKRHLFAYAGEDKPFTAGNQRLIASVNGWKINLIVCYDLRFPVWIRQQSDEECEYDLLICIANWPERRRHAWRTLAQARAIENQCYVAAVNRVGKDGHNINHTGDSMVIDPLGEILQTVEHNEDVITVKLEKESLETVRNKMPFWKDADVFILPVEKSEE